MDFLSDEGIITARPEGVCEARTIASRTIASRYDLWLNTYQVYLIDMYNTYINAMTENILTFKQFAYFIYNNSSKYISENY